MKVKYLFPILIGLLIVGLSFNPPKICANTTTKTVQFFWDNKHHPIEIPIEVPNFMGFRRKIIFVGTSLLEIQFIDPKISTNKYVLICSQKVEVYPDMVGLIYVKGSKLKYWTYTEGLPTKVTVIGLARHVQNYRIVHEN